MFLSLAWERLSILRLIGLIAHVRAAVPGALLAHDGNFRNGVTFDDFARYILLMISFAACGVLLLFSRRPRHGPNTATEVVVPFAATFSSLAFDPHVSLPAWTVAPLIPDDWKPLLASVGVAVSLAALTASVYALCWLGVRWVRHPIYLGCLSVMLGMFMVSRTPRMEERLLCAPQPVLPRMDGTDRLPVAAVVG